MANLSIFSVLSLVLPCLLHPQVGPMNTFCYITYAPLGVFGALVESLLFYQILGLIIQVAIKLSVSNSAISNLICAHQFRSK